MDHEAYENHMIEAINQHGEEAAKDAVNAKSNPVINKNDSRVVVVGLKRTLIALLTAATLAIAILGLVTVAKVSGYMAVLLFFASVLALIGSFILLYAQGLPPKITKESKGDHK